ncbi:MAG: fibrobacter succinogenes major paralogous domain-containing protein, partial [Bacteroidota bacterium]
SNGDPILEAKTDEEWKKAIENKQPAWCYYKNDPSNGEKYGKLYNWYAVDDSRGISPVGWHVPTVEEYQELIQTLGGANFLGEDSKGIAGSQLKSTSDWKQNLYVNNSTNFSALPGGARASDGYFSSQGYHGYWWCSTDKDTETALSQHLAYYPNDLVKQELNKGYGISVRCLKGEESQKKTDERQKKEDEK